MLKRDATLIFSIFCLSWPILWAILRLAYDYFPQLLNKTCFSTSGTVSPPTSQAAALPAPEITLRESFWVSVPFSSSIASIFRNVGLLFLSVSLSVLWLTATPSLAKFHTLAIQSTKGKKSWLFSSVNLPPILLLLQ